MKSRLKFPSFLLFFLLSFAFLFPEKTDASAFSTLNEKVTTFVDMVIAWFVPDVVVSTSTVNPVTYIVTETELKEAEESVADEVNIPVYSSTVTTTAPSPVIYRTSSPTYVTNNTTYTNSTTTYEGDTIVRRSGGTSGLAKSVSNSNEEQNEEIEDLELALAALQGDVDVLSSSYTGSGQWFTNGTDVYRPTGNVGIGTSTPDYKLTVAGDTNQTGALRFNGNSGITGYILQSNGSSAPAWVATTSLGFATAASTTALTSSLTTNYVPKWNGSAFTNSLVYDNGTNVGIGTTTPSEKLSVVGNGFFTGTVSGANAVASNQFVTLSQLGASTTNAFVQGGNTFGTTAILGTNDAQSLQFETNNSPAVTILSGGNVGIGTTSPIARLSVVGAAGSNPFTIASSTGSKLFEINQAGAALFGNSAGTSGYVLQSTGVGGSPAWVATSSLGFAAAGSGVTSFNGRTGAVVSSSSDYTTSLVTEGSNLYYTDVRSRSALSSSATGLTYATSTGIFSLTSGYNIPLTASTTQWNDFYTTPSTRITAGTGLSWTGNTLNNTGVTSIGGLTGAVSTSSLGINSSQWTTNGTSIYYNTGNVGIGTSSPAFKLDIAGDTNQTGALRFNGNSGTTGFILQSNGSSAPSWVATSSLGFSSGSSAALTSGLSTNYVPKWNGSAFANSLMYDDGTGINIGTTANTGAYKLNVAGSVNLNNGKFILSNTSLVLDGLGTFGQNQLTVNTGTLALVVDTSSNVGIGVQPSGTSKLQVNGNFVASGNVGIGTTTPSAKLEIVDAFSATSKNVFIRTTDALAADKGGALAFGGLSTTGGTVTSFGAIAGKKVNGTTADEKGYLQFNVAADYGGLFEVMRIVGGSGGTPGLSKVGIGTSSPTAKLEVVDINSITHKNVLIRTNDAYGIDIGGSLSLGGLSDAVGTVTSFGAIAGRKANGAASDGKGYLQFNVASDFGQLNEAMRIVGYGGGLAGGNVGIGTSTPSNKFQVIGGDSAATSSHAIKWGNPTQTTLGYLGAADPSYASGAIYLFNGGNLNTVISATSNQKSYFGGGNVGFGNTNPQSKLDINGDVRLSAQTTVGTGNGSKLVFDYGANGTFLSGISALVPGNATAGLEFFTAPSSGATTTRMTLLGNGNLGIGTTTPSAQLTTTGTVRFAAFGAGTLQTDSQGNVSVSSDERLKDIDGEYTKGLDAIMGLVPITYHWKKLSGLETSDTYLGFSAQNVKVNIPEAVGEDMKGFLTLSDRGILATLVNAVKELAVKFEEMAESLTTKKVTTDELCIAKSDGGEVCVTGDKLEELLGGEENTTHTPDPVEENDEEETPPETTEEEEVTGEELSEETDAEASTEAASAEPAI